MNPLGPQLTIQTVLNPYELYTDARTHGYQGPTRNVRLPRVTPAGGGGAIAKSEDGTRCAVVGHNYLRILRISPPSPTHKPEHKSAIGEGGHRIDVSKNFWDSGTIKVDSFSTDVAWGCGQYNNKILTSARNAEVILWDLDRSGIARFERRAKDHVRSVNSVCISSIVHYYCVTGSNDGDVRVWDLRDMSKSIMRVHHPTAVRSLVFSPSTWQPLQVVVGLESGSIYRWDLKMGQRGQLDRLHVAHTKAVMALDWCPSGGVIPAGVTPLANQDASIGGLGWLASGALDHTVKVWDLTSPIAASHIPHKPTYTLHPSYPVRRIAWRPGYECELAVVSTAEHATPAESLLQHTSTGSASGYLTRVGSTADLSALLRVPSNLEILKEKLALHTLTEGRSQALSSDAVEIWDVRRGWIGKWSITGSGADGGISDIAFSDSHALWAQHSNGTFSQLDLREATKPIDAIPRVSAAWEPTASLAFAVDKPGSKEIPYDDINPDGKPETKRPGFKALGDPQAQTAMQVTATYAHDFLDNDLDTFTALARGYIFEGMGKKDICIFNAGVALAAGNESAAQVWLLLGASVSDYLPQFPPIPSMSPPLYTSSKAPSPKPSSFKSKYSLPPPFSTKPPSDSNSLYRISPGRSMTPGSLSRVPSGSALHRLTPTSSASSSPRHLPNALPPLTPRRASFLTHRDSNDYPFNRAIMLRRPSISVAPGSYGTLPVSHSASPSEKMTPSHRHVGEGVLDDDSSSDENKEDGADSSDDNYNPKALSPNFSEGLGLSNRVRPTPSPLSRVASRGSAYGDLAVESSPIRDEEEDDDMASSPSPQSTSDAETGSEGSTSPRKPSKPRSRSNSYSKQRRGFVRPIKSRSRSSTLASLAAAPRPRLLTHQESHSSIKTVTGVDSSFRESEDVNYHDIDGHGLVLGQEDHVIHRRQKSAPLSEYLPNSSMRSVTLPLDLEENKEFHDPNYMTERRIDNIRADDKRFKETTLAALREALEQYGEEGDTQMCAMLALVAGDELGVSKFQKIRFVDSYIDLLSRLRLHACAAYIRKFCNLDSVKKLALLGTSIYTSCGKCRKALLVAAGPSNTEDTFQGRWAYCSNCQAPAVMCGICRLPVRAMLFQCSICHHGGHQECYRQFYMNSPMMDMPASLLSPSNDLRGRQSTRPPPYSTSSIIDDDTASMASMQSNSLDALPQSLQRETRPAKLQGHPCAAGCGHFCWAASGVVEES